MNKINDDHPAPLLRNARGASKMESASILNKRFKAESVLHVAYVTAQKRCWEQNPAYRSVLKKDGYTEEGIPRGTILKNTL